MSNNLLKKLMQEPEVPDVHISGAERRSEAIYRLQIGFAGLLGIVLMIAVSDAISSRAEKSAAEAVPTAAATLEPTDEAQPQIDPLAEAGLVPDLPTLDGTEEEASAPEGATKPPSANRKNAPEKR